jgi:RNA polymerase sigma-70 factor (ECF subfamily)
MRRDAELVRRSLAGDRDAFGNLVRAYHGELLRFLRGITRNQDDAEDAAQEAFLRAFRFLDSYDPSRPFRAWLWTIGAREAMRILKKKDRRHLSLETSGSEDEDSFAPEASWHADASGLERLDAQLLRRALMEGLDRLPPDHRAVLILRIVEQRSYEEIAEILEIPTGTVMSRINRARIRLRKALRGWAPEGGNDV